MGEYQWQLHGAGKARKGLVLSRLANKLQLLESNLTLGIERQEHVYNVCRSNSSLEIRHNALKEFVCCKALGFGRYLKTSGQQVEYGKRRLCTALGDCLSYFLQ